MSGLSMRMFDYRGVQVADYYRALAQRGRSLFRRPIAAADGAADIEQLARRLLSNRGEASGVALAAGLVQAWRALDTEGQPTMVSVGKYGLHALRHACASLWIEQGYNPKQIQTLMGHSSIKVTFDTYGHLMPGGLDEAARVTNAYLARRDTERPPLKVADG